MSTADRRRLSIRKASGITALLAGVGIVGFLAVRSSRDAPDGAKQAGGEPVPASEVQRPLAATSAPVDVASRAVVATLASSPAAAATTPWHASLQPAVVTATRVESLAPLQVQMERWACEGQQCVGNFRIPPTVAASRNMSSAAQVFNSLKEQMAEQDIDVAVSSIQPGPQGLALALQFTPNAAVPRRVYTDREITDIRAESFEQGHKAAEQEPAVRGRDPAH